LIFTDMWISGIRAKLIDSGIPQTIVARHISFLLIYLPVWFVLFSLCFALGMMRHRWTRVAAFSLALWMPIMHFVGAVMVFIWYSIPNDFRMLFSLKICLVSSVGIPVGLLGWFLGRMAIRFSRSHKPPRSPDVQGGPLQTQDGRCS